MFSIIKETCKNTKGCKCCYALPFKYIEPKCAFNFLRIKKKMFGDCLVLKQLKFFQMPMTYVFRPI